MNLNKNRVLVGLSGGVDSSTVAALLKDQGYEVIGITITSIKIEDSCKQDDRTNGCCNMKAIQDAMDVADELGIEHHVIDLSEIFREKIINNFISEYLKGRTPNPCTLCNPIIKWGEILKKADSYDCQYYATGHYANVRFDNHLNRYIISRGKDEIKDQSYFLWGLTQDQLSRTIFPLGNIEKEKTRSIAKEHNIPVFNKNDSQEICFVPTNDYKDFLISAQPELKEKFINGDIVFDGMVVGKHRGFPFYTLGQRKGLGVSYHKPVYVKEIIPETNTIIIGTEEDILSMKLIAENLNMIKYINLDPQKDYNVKIRYRDKGSPAKAIINDDGLLEVCFLEPRKAITPGQSVVICEGDDLVCGAVILSAS